MGIGFVLLFAAVAGLVLASCGAVVLGLAGAHLTKGVPRGRKRLIWTAASFPFLCLGWMGTVFVLQALINQAVFHRDPGLGDEWTCPLPDGYAILMIDTTDQGWVYNPKTQPEEAVSEQADSISGVRTMQVAGRYILGGSDGRSFESSEDDSSKRVDTYFVLDTQAGRHTDFASYDALRVAAQKLGIIPHLEDIAAIYNRYRFTWFDVLAALLTFLPPAAGAVLLVLWVLRLRKIRGRLPHPTTIP